uniref:G domain-containing protein n=1 Tax=Syphacia muris TaxID=451379 RepID=A0A0N5ASM8_9BILA
MAPIQYETFDHNKGKITGIKLGRRIRSIVEVLREIDRTRSELSANRLEALQNRIIVGITGCSNAGKTTLARNIVKMIDWSSLQQSIISSANCNDYVIVEGNMLAANANVVQLLDLLIFMTLDKQTCLERRLQRSDYNPPDKPGYFNKVVWPTYERYLNDALLTLHKLRRLWFFDGCFYDLTLNSSEAILQLISTIIYLLKDPIGVNYMKIITNAGNSAISTYSGYYRSCCNKLQISKGSEYLTVHRTLQQFCHNIRKIFERIDKILIVLRIGDCKANELNLLIGISGDNEAVVSSANLHVQHLIQEYMEQKSQK